MRRVRQIERFSDECHEIQLQQLTQLLDEAKNTEYGRKHGFARLQDINDFKKAVPLVRYEDLRPYIMQMVEGKSDVLWRGVTRNFAQSSGTSDGKSKYIPITGRALSRGHYAGAAFSLASYLHYHPDSRVFGGKNFILGGSFANELSLPTGVKVGDLSATLIDRINPLVNLFRIPSKEIALMERWEEKLPALVEASIRADVRSISGVPSWFLTVLRRVLETTGAKDIHSVWPNLEVFFHGGIAFGPYRSQYAAITDPARMRYWENYNASEGFFGLQDDPSDPAMLLMIDYDVFYEFIPLEEVGNPEAKAVALWDVETGKNYAIVISTSCGLWRYQIGDTVKFTSKNPYKFIISGRTKSFINAFGEELMVDNAEKGLAEACRETGAQVAEYTAAPVFMDIHGKCRHQWVIEFAKRPENMDVFAEKLDKALQRINSDYEAKRSNNVTLQQLEITEAKPGLFNEWLASKGKLGGQHKVPRLNNTRKIIDEILSLNSK